MNAALNLAGRAVPRVALLLVAAYGTDAAVQHQWLGVAAAGIVTTAVLVLQWRVRHEYRHGHLVGRLETFTALGEAAERDRTMEDWLMCELTRHHADSAAWGFHQCRKTADAPECRGHDDAPTQRS